MSSHYTFCEVSPSGEVSHSLHVSTHALEGVPCTFYVVQILCIVFAVLPSCGHKPPQLVTTPSSALQVFGSA